jgi:hypothetical protein
LGERQQFGRGNALGREIDQRGAYEMRQRASQCVQGAALIVQVENAVVMIIVGSGNSRDMPVRVAGDRRRFENVESVIVHQRNDAGDLGDDEEAQETSAQAADRSNEHRSELGSTTADQGVERLR